MKVFGFLIVFVKVLLEPYLKSVSCNDTKLVSFVPFFRTVQISPDYQKHSAPKSAIF